MFQALPALRIQQERKDAMIRDLRSHHSPATNLDVQCIVCHKGTQGGQTCPGQHRTLQGGMQLSQAKGGLVGERWGGWRIQLERNEFMECLVKMSLKNHTSKGGMSSWGSLAINMSQTAQD